MAAGRCDETIVAVITPPGEGGIAALRIAGKRSLSFLESHFRSTSEDSPQFKPFLMRYGHFVGRDGNVIDEVMAVYMPAGRSYTGLPQVEIFCHGGRQVVQLIQQQIVNDGARMSEPGEFTRLAFLSGRIDLAKAEAVAEIIAANTDSSFGAAREHLLGAYAEHVTVLREALVDIAAEIEASIDFPEEDIDAAGSRRLVEMLDRTIGSIGELVESYTGGRIIDEGYRIAIGGRPNAGKSSLFNLLLRQERALVTPTAGTTRDYLSEWIDLGGFKVNIIDTAGLRRGGGQIERAGQKSAKRIIDSSDILLWMVDLSKKNWQAELKADIKALEKTAIILLGNKIDAVPIGAEKAWQADSNNLLLTSCKTRKGIADLKKSLIVRINDKMPDLTDGLVVTSARHKQKLAVALKALRAARRKMAASESPELTAFDLRLAIGAIDEITGRIYTDEILGKIFSRFCVGK